MKRETRLAIGCIACLCLLASPLWAQDDSTPKLETEKDTAAIMEVVAGYAKAFNERNVDALMAYWTEGGVYVDRPTGEMVNGRAALTEEFKKVLKDEQAPTMKLTTESIEFVSPRVAMERGLALLVKGDKKVSETRYDVVYLKEGGKWLIDRVTEHELTQEESRYERLKGLEWMIGQWVDAGEGFSIDIDCQWTANRTYISRRYSVSSDDGALTSSGMQIIGWDPKQKKIRSWLFDSAGGFVAGVWTSSDNRWVVQSVATLADGSTGSFTSVFKPLEDGSYTWQKTNRVVEGQLLPNLDEVVVQRK